MNHSSVRYLVGTRGRAALLIAAASFVAIGSALTSAAQVSAPAATMSIDNVRDSFINSGFKVDQPYAWTWMNPPFTSLQVHDLASQRVLMILIYPDAASARTARSQALAHEPGQAEPHLIEGYGPSVWSENVGIVESTQSELNHILQSRLDQANGLDIDTNLAWEHSVTNDAVDLDFRRALVNTRTIDL